MIHGVSEGETRAVLDRIDAALAECGVEHAVLTECGGAECDDAAEEDTFPWGDAAVWTPAIAAGAVEQWAVGMDAGRAAWFRAWVDESAPPWAVDPHDAEDERLDWWA